MDISIWGFVRAPGRYRVPSYTKLLELISLAGGPDERARLDEVKVVHDLTIDSTITQAVTLFNLEEYQLYRQSPVEPVLTPNDIIIVPGDALNEFNQVLSIISDVAVVTLRSSASSSHSAETDPMFRPIHRFALLLAALALIAAVPFLQGCGGGGGGESTTSDGKTVITFWHFQSEPGQKKALLDRIKAFEEENAGIHVELQDLNWNDGKTKLLAAFNSNTAPDVIELGSDWVAQFSSAGVLADQAGMKEDDPKRFSAEVLAPGQWDKGIYAWPWTTDTRVLFYNKDLLASSGIDTTAIDSLWDDVLAKGEKVRAANPELYGFGANGSDRHRLYKKILPFFWSNGGEVLDAKGTPAINSPENVAALDMYLSLARSGFIDSQKGLDQLFLGGKLAYWISGPWLVDRIAKDNPKLHYGVAPLPKFAGKNAVSFAGGEYLAINADAKNKAEAKKLITFLTSPKQALEFAKELPGGTTPADMSVAGDPFLQGPARKVFTEQLRFARMTPVHPKWLELEEIIEDEVAGALLGQKSAQQALDAANARMAQIAGGGAAATGEEGTN